MLATQVVDSPLAIPFSDSPADVSDGILSDSKATHGVMAAVSAPNPPSQAIATQDVDRLIDGWLTDSPHLVHPQSEVSNAIDLSLDALDRLFADWS